LYSCSVYLDALFSGRVKMKDLGATGIDEVGRYALSGVAFLRGHGRGGVTIVEVSGGERGAALRMC
jgi:hypothetical protein